MERDRSAPSRRARRARLAEHVARAWTGEGRYVDPLLDAAGHAAIDLMVAAVQIKFPGHRFRRVSGIDTHHDQLRFAWELIAPDGAVVAGGIDVGELAPDGRLGHSVGFFGELPQPVPV